jgi:D-tyrosyl-tRNA(Tyr) deacylase
MLALLQLVSHADVTVASQPIAAIKQGILALIGLERGDNEIVAAKLFDRIINYRIFNDNNQKMNLSLKSVQGGLLLIPQFTLVAETQKGTRPGFSRGMPPDEGKELFEYLVNHAKSHYPHIATGEFGASMQVNLCNEGPVTFMLKVEN